MRRSVLAITAAVLLLASLTTAHATAVAAPQLPLPHSDPSRHGDPSFPQPGSRLMSAPDANPDRTIVGPSAGRGGMTLADALTLERKAGVWWDYARDVSSVVGVALFSACTRPRLPLPPPP